MAKENERQALQEYDNRKRRYKRRRRAAIIMVFLLLCLISVGYLFTLSNKNYNGYTVLKTTAIKGSNAIGYCSYGSGLVKYSKDGIIAIGKNGNLIWNGSYEMSDPIIDICDKYIAIADRGGKSIHIFNEKGVVGNIPTEYPILKVEIASQGVVAALMETEDGNDTALYDSSDGTLLVQKLTYKNNEGYPMDFSMSNDGKKLVFSYLSYKEGKIIDMISFYNLGDVGQNFTDKLAGGFNMDEGEIVPRVAFVNNDTVCVFKDNSLRIYSIDEIPSEICEVPYDGKVQSIFYNEKYAGIVSQADGAPSEKLFVYSLNGKKVLDKKLEFKYEDIRLIGDEIIMNDNMSCLIMKVSGKIKFKDTLESNIKAFYPANHMDRYYLASDSKLMEIQLK